MSSQSGVVSNDARKSVFFQLTRFRNSTWPKKLSNKGFLMQKTLRNPLVTISELYLMPFWQKLTIYATYPQKCTQKRAPYHTLRPLNPLKTWFEAPKLFLKDCPPLISNTYASPPFSFTPSYILISKSDPLPTSLRLNHTLS